ncbi:hypothetical protein J2X37_000022 [Croceicoccus sp. BE223]|nr:hypothetical protein [Croceicoccus sp. BE223]
MTCRERLYHALARDFLPKEGAGGDVPKMKEASLA